MRNRAMVRAEFDYFTGRQGRNRNIARSGTGWRKKIGLWRGGLNVGSTYSI